MNTKYFQKNRSAFITLTVIMIVYYLLARLSLFMCDDYRYAFIQGTNIHVDGLKDAITSQCHAYMHENGRFLVHVIVQYFAGVLGMGWLAVFNTIMFGVLIVFTSKLICEQNSSLPKYLVYLFIVLGLIIGMPHFANVFIGNIAISVNYLWTSAASVVFIYTIMYLRNHKVGKVTTIALSIFAFIAGCMQESFSIGIAAGLFVYLLINRKYIDRNTFLISAMYMIGTAIVVLAPSNFSRAGVVNAGTSTIVRIVSNTTKVLLASKTFDLTLLIVAWFLYRDYMSTLSFLKDNILIVVAILVNVVFISIVAYTGAHQLTCTELLSLILLVRFFVYCNVLSSFLDWKFASPLLITLLLILVIPGYYYRNQIYHAYNQMIESARNSMDGYMIGGDFDKYSYEKRNWYIRNFCTTELNKDTPLWSLSYYLTAGKDRNFITSRIPLPKEEICNLASLGNTAKDGVSITDCGYFYIVKSKQPLCVISVVYNNLLTKLKAKLLNVNVTCSNMDIDKVCKFEYGDEHYYIVYNNQEHPLKIIDAH